MVSGEFPNPMNDFGDIGPQECSPRKNKDTVQNLKYFIYLFKAKNVTIIIIYVQT